MQVAMRLLESGESFGWELTRQQRDLSAFGRVLRRSDVRRILENDASLGDELPEPFAVFARIAIQAADFKKVLPVSPHFRFEGCTRTFRRYPSSVFMRV